MEQTACLVTGAVQFVQEVPILNVFVVMLIIIMMELIANNATLFVLHAKELWLQTVPDAQSLNIFSMENVFLVALLLFRQLLMAQSDSAAPLALIPNTSTITAAVLTLVILASLLLLTNLENSANFHVQLAALFTLMPLVITTHAPTHLSKPIMAHIKSANTSVLPAKWPSNPTPPASLLRIVTLLTLLPRMVLISPVSLLVLPLQPQCTPIGTFLV